MDSQQDMGGSGEDGLFKEPLLQDTPMRDMILSAVSRMSHEGKNAEATRVVENIVALLRSGGDAREETARLLFLAEMYRESAEIYGELAKETDRASHWNDRGVSLSRMGKHREAVKAYRTSLTLKPDSANVWFNLGKAFYRMGRMWNAVSSFSKSVSLDPENKSAWNNLGISYRVLGKHQQARECYNRALGIDQRYAWALHNMGVLMMETGDKSGAVNMLKKAVESKPDHAPSIEMLASLLDKESV